MRSFLTLCFCLGGLVIHEPSAGSDPVDATPAILLVSQALTAEAAGDLQKRDQLLNEASQVDLRNSRARWYQGQVLDFSGAWLSTEELINSAKSDTRLAQYEALRMQLPSSVQNNWVLAKWCAEHRLVQQCRAHVENILIVEHDNELARKILGHRLVGNDWLTPNDQLLLQEQAAFAQEGFKSYGSTLRDLTNKLQSTNAQAKRNAIAAIQAIDSPLAIPVMESLIGTNQDVSKIVLRWLGAMDHQLASFALARAAVLLDDDDLRSVAIEQLKRKSPFDYIPDLLNALSSPIAFQSAPMFSPDGVFQGYRQAFARETMNSFQLLDAQSTIQYRDINIGVPSKTVDGPTMNSGYKQSAEGTQAQMELNELNIISILLAEGSAILEADHRQRKAVSDNARIAQLNHRITALVSEISGEEFADSPRDVWQWWDRYNETNYQSDKSQRQQYSNSSYEVRLYHARMVPEFNAYQGKTSRVVTRTLASSQMRSDPNPMAQLFSSARGSCFVAGTKVNTLRGLKEIETVRPGDMVLSRNIMTGELCYKPVIASTTRRPAKTVILEIDEESVHATTSHLLWVCGKGWTKAGQIKRGDLLHTAAEPAVVMKATPSEELPTYNLIVADTHTYFVGTSKILSHDVLPRGAVRELTPGQFAFDK